MNRTGMMNRSHGPRPLACAMAALGLLATAGPALGAGPKPDPVAGLEVAQQNCAACHLVDASTQPRVQADVPTFREIAAREGISAEQIAGFIVIPHPPMPSLALTRVEIANVAAYIMSLGTDGAAP